MDITNDGGAEINMLTALGFNPVPGSTVPAPVILSGGIVSLGTTSSTLQSGSWASIYGTNLAAATRVWKDSEIVNNNLPTSLDGVSVKVNGKAAYMYFISPGQLNFQVPDDTATGSVTVTVTNANGTSNAGTATLASVGPAIFTLDGKYPAAVIPSATGVYNAGTPGAYDLLGPAGKFAFNTRPAKKGEIVALYATGLGATSPATPAGRIVSVVAKTVNQVTVLIGGVSQTVDAYIIGAGTYQFNVTIPQTAASGDNTLVIRTNGVQTAAGTVLTVQ